MPLGQFSSTHITSYPSILLVRLIDVHVHVWLTASTCSQKNKHQNDQLSWGTHLAAAPCLLSSSFTFLQKTRHTDDITRSLRISCFHTLLLTPGAVFDIQVPPWHTRRCVTLTVLQWLVKSFTVLKFWSWTGTWTRRNYQIQDPAWIGPRCSTWTAPDQVTSHN